VCGTESDCSLATLSTWPVNPRKMTNELLEFSLRASVIWGALLGYYFLVLQRNDNWRLRRVFLLSAWIMGLLIPVLPSLSLAPEIPVVRLVLPEVAFGSEMPALAGPEVTTSQGYVVPLMLSIYLLGLSLVFARALVHGWRIMRWSREGEKSTYLGYRVVRHGSVTSPFAAWGRIFLPLRGLEAAVENIALIHEAAHLRQRHHYDTFLMMIGQIVFWFHPLQWVFGRQLSDLHEFEADAAVTQLVPVRTYGFHLLQSSLAPTGALGLFSSPLQKRITMMTKTKVRQPLRTLSLFGLLGLVSILIVACSELTEDALPSEAPLPSVERLAGEDGSAGVDTSLGNDFSKRIQRRALSADEASLGGFTDAVEADILLSGSGDVLDVTLVRVDPSTVDQKEASLLIGSSGIPMKLAGKRLSVFSDEFARELYNLDFQSLLEKNGSR
jgi:hypothetical protein